MAIYRRRGASVVGVPTGGVEQILWGQLGEQEAADDAATRAFLSALAGQSPNGITASSKKEVPSAGEVWGGVAFFALCVVAGVALIETDVAFAPPEGIGAFAVFYVIALAIERLLEFLDAPLESVLKTIGRRKDKPTLELQRDQAIATAANTSPAGASGQTSPANESDSENPADKQADVNMATKGRSIALAGVSGGLGVLSADYLNADFLGAVGVTGLAEWVALTTTGLVVAGGSKQLHDLIANVSKASDEKATPEETGGSASS